MLASSSSSCCLSTDSLGLLQVIDFDMTCVCVCVLCISLIVGTELLSNIKKTSCFFLLETSVLPFVTACLGCQCDLLAGSSSGRLHLLLILMRSRMMIGSSRHHEINARSASRTTKGWKRRHGNSIPRGVFGRRSMMPAMMMVVRLLMVLILLLLLLHHVNAGTAGRATGLRGTTWQRHGRSRVFFAIAQVGDYGTGGHDLGLHDINAGTTRLPTPRRHAALLLHLFSQVSLNFNVSLIAKSHVIFGEVKHVLNLIIFERFNQVDYTKGSSFLEADSLGLLLGYHCCVLYHCGIL